VQCAPPAFELEPESFDRLALVVLPLGVCKERLFATDDLFSPAFQLISLGQVGLPPGVDFRLLCGDLLSGTVDALLLPVDFAAALSQLVALAIERRLRRLRGGVLLLRVGVQRRLAAVQFRAQLVDFGVLRLELLALRFQLPGLLVASREPGGKFFTLPLDAALLVFDFVAPPREFLALPLELRLQGLRLLAIARRFVRCFVQRRFAAVQILAQPVELFALRDDLLTLVVQLRLLLVELLVLQAQRIVLGVELLAAPRELGLLLVQPILATLPSLLAFAGLPVEFIPVAGELLGCRGKCLAVGIELALPLLELLPARGTLVAQLAGLLRMLIHLERFLFDLAPVPVDTIACGGEFVLLPSQLGLPGG
jgi:hypothetical protein